MNLKFSGMLSLFGEGARRFPFVALAAVAGTATGIACNHGLGGSESGVLFWKIIQLSLLAFLLFAGASYLGELRPFLRWPSVIAAAIALVGLWFRIPQEKALFATIYAYLATALALLFLVIAIPGVGGHGAWWRINVGGAQALVLAFAVTLIIGIGLMLASYSISTLFGLEMNNIHADIMLAAPLLFAPLAVIALLPGVEEERPMVLEGFWRNLGLWVLVPLGFLFVAIIAAYAGFILVLREFPDGMVAMPVLALGAYGTSAMLLLQPWRESHGAACWFARIYPPAFLAASILLFMALNVRLGDYGMTFARYTALAAGVWLAIAAVVFLLRIAASGMVIMMTGMLFALAASFGPFSAATLSLRSQSERLKALLAARNPGMGAGQIRSGVNFLAENFGLAALEKVTGPLGLDPGMNRWDMAREAARKLGVSDSPGGIIMWSGKHPMDISKFSKLYPSDDTRCTLGQAEDGRELEVIIKNSRQCVKAGKEEILDLMPLIKAALADRGNPGQVVDDPVQIPFRVDGRGFVLVLQDVEWNKEGSEIMKFQSKSYFVLETGM